ncbi:MAG: hypothetical protein ABI846_10265 [Rudaea sp.]
MRNLKDDETAVVSGSDADSDNGIYFTQDGAPILSPGLVGPPDRMPIVPFMPGWPVG